MANLLGRALTNELETLLERLNPQAIVALSQKFPKLQENLARGPDAGVEAGDRKFYEDKAALASALCHSLVPEILSVSDKIIERAASLSSSKVAVAILAGLGGVATLTAFGLGKEDVTRISGLITSTIAILNAGLDSFSKRYSSAESQKAIELRSKGIQLNQSCREMELSVQHQRTIEEIVAGIQSCNQLALELNQKKDHLRTI